jgi:6,7-dimethyl-8-ribityllumazine synthase
MAAQRQSASGKPRARGLRVGIVAGRFNDFIVAPLIDGAVGQLAEQGALAKDVQVWRVPGAFELPLAAQKLAAGGHFDAVVALGAVIRGDTPHFDYVAGECAAGLTRVALDTGVPVIFGVLTTDTERQARDRAGGKLGNKGAEAAMTAIDMVHLLRGMPGGTSRKATGRPAAPRRARRT